MNPIHFEEDTVKLQSQKLLPLPKLELSLTIFQQEVIPSYRADGHD